MTSSAPPPAPTGPKPGFFAQFQHLTSPQRTTFLASMLGWSLDAFDYFILVLCVTSISSQFKVQISAVMEAVFLTLAMRPVGAFIFGLFADRYGRRPALLTNIICYSFLELASAFAPSLHAFLIIRALFGIGMGGEWGVGAALAFETLPAEGRGFFSGLLQEGYVIGYLFAAAVYGLFFSFVGWRGMFVIGALPAVLVIFILNKVEESPAWVQGRVSRERARPISKDIWSHAGI